MVSLRTAKPGNDWTMHDLGLYNISLVPQKVDTFFGVHDLPAPTVNAELLLNLEAYTMQSNSNAELINLMNLADIGSSEESAAKDFIVELFKMTGYVCRGRVVVKCFEDKEAFPEARAQLVANALAVYAENNVHRDHMGLPALDCKVIHGILMEGTSPTFFKIPVTKELVTHVNHGTYPPTPTVVTYCSPPVLCSPRRREHGMKPLEGRYEILQCFEAFKTTVGI